MVKLATQLVKRPIRITQMCDNKSILDYILEQCNGIDLKASRFDPDFFRYISEQIENEVEKKKKDDEKIKKMELFEMIIKKLFPDIKQDELTMCKNIVENLLKNKLVRKTKLSKIMIFYLKKKFCLCSE